MELVRYEQLRELLALRIAPELRELRRRQTVLQTTIWIGMTCMLAGMVILLGLVGVVISAID
jgi:type VI protein secretion system component VasF